MLKDQLESSDRGITQSNNNSKKKYSIIVYLSLESLYIQEKVNHCFCVTKFPVVICDIILISTKCF